MAETRKKTPPRVAYPARPTRDLRLAIELQLVLLQVDPCADYGKRCPPKTMSAAMKNGSKRA
ncbi:hypothetical protein ASC63_05400 [Leifsonia sp. Root112D2]|nr:hypothetical protein ASC63_05400 [Leifsonia sp. Root112D2]